MPRYVAMMNTMMRETLQIGTAQKAQLPGWPAAGKTGTSQDFRDAWFIGYTGHLVTGVWLGNDDSSPTKKATGGGLPVEIWSPLHEDRAPGRGGRGPAGIGGRIVIRLGALAGDARRRRRRPRRARRRNGGQAGADRARARRLVHRPAVRTAVSCSRPIEVSDSRLARRAPSPIGRGWGEGLRSTNLVTPSPLPSPQTGRGSAPRSRLAL